MLDCSVMLCKGKGKGAYCRLSTLRGQSAVWQLHAGNTPLPCIALLGHGRYYTAKPLDRPFQTISTCEMTTQGAWLALCAADGTVWGWGSWDGLWHETMGNAIAQHFAPALDQSKTEKATDDTPAIDTTPRQEERAFDAPPCTPISDGDIDKQPTDAAAALEPTATEEASDPTEDAAQATAPTNPTVQAPLSDDPQEQPPNPKPSGDAAQQEQADAPQAWADGAEKQKGEDYRTIPPQYAAYFDACPPCDALQQVFADSRFVTVSQDDAVYVLGLLYNGQGQPTHLCYGVPGTRDCPLRDAQWISTAGDKGYWLLYNAL